jgi:hypothetical protein
MASREIQIAVPTWGCFVGEGPFLWFVSFGPAKEMNSAATADETLLGLCAASGIFKIKRFRPLARPSSFLLKSVKRNEPKKNACLDKALPQWNGYRDFSTRHPGSVEKRRTSVCTALRVWGQP